MEMNDSPHGEKTSINKPQTRKGAKPRSLSRRLAIGLSISVGMVSAITVLALYYSGIREEEARLIKKADQYRDYLLSALEVPLWNLDKPTVEAICKAFMQRENVVEIEIRDQWGVFFKAVVPGEYQDKIVRTDEIFHRGVLLGTIELSLSKQYSKEIGHKLLSSYVTIMLLVLVALVILTQIFVRFLLKKPIRAFDMILRPYSEGRYDLPVPQLPYLEFQAFGTTLAQMGETIKLQMEELRKHHEHLEELIEERTVELTAAKDQAEKANCAKSVFLANMSHELRTPLNAVLGFSQVMRNAPDVTPEQKEHLNIITRSGEHLLNLINNVLDISKIESGRVELEESSFNLHQLIQEIKSLMYMRAQGKGLDFLLEQAPDLPRHVVADGGKLRQILINLIGNAIKFTQQGGVILRAGVIRPEADARMVMEFEVEDTGPGIPEENRETVFAPFLQLQLKDRASLESGTGLGLAICKQYVEMMGGTIRMDSELGKGTVFHIDLPVAVLSDEAVSLEPRRTRVIGLAEGQSRYRLLIAEDQPENRLLLRKLLEPLGFEVLEAVNGQEAVAMFTQWRPHLIWMDIRMPVMDGLEATRRIRTTPAGIRTRIVAFTAHALEEERREIMAAGCDDFIRKPYKDVEIFEALTKNLGVRFVHGEETAAAAMELDAAILADLPKELLKELEQALVRIDIGEVNRVIDAIGTYNSSLSGFFRGFGQGSSIRQASADDSDRHE